MRRFTLIQDIATDVAGHWQLFLDEKFDREQYLEGFKFPRYQLVDGHENEREVVRVIKVTPRLDVPTPVARLLGAGFAYTEEGRFDKRSQVWRSRLIPSILADRLHSESVVRAEAAGEGRCRRTCELSVEARILGLGGLVEGALEKNLRDGWSQAAAYLNRRLSAVT